MVIVPDRATRADESAAGVAQVPERMPGKLAGP